MAKVYGQLPLNKAEKEVVLELKSQLPADWLVIPGVRWAKRNEKGFVRDGEADVVTLVPAGGMLVIEVKGSRNIRVTESGWQRKEGDEWIVLDRSPVDQATSNAHELKRIVCDELGWRDGFPGLLGWMALYPNGNANEIPALLDHTTLATRAHMGTLRAKVQQALVARGHETIARNFTAPVMDKVAKVLTSAAFRIVPADGAQEVVEDKDVIEHLTKQQFSALKGLFELPSVAVAGPAGSGKTILAIWRLESSVEAGKRALYVCFNKDLAESLRLKNPSLASHIHSVNKLFGTKCPGLSNRGDIDRFYREELPSHVFDEVSGWSEDKKYDVILVDEAQDLNESQILALHSFLKAEGVWAVFLDRRQDIFHRQVDEVLAADVIYRLSHNCRNTVTINKATNAYVGSEVDSMPGMPLGIAVTVERVNRAQMADRAFRLAKEWKSGGQNSVAILSPFTLGNSSMAGQKKGHGVALIEDLHELQDAGKVYFSTIKSFKGIEADCVVLIDAIDPGQGKLALTMEDLYVACTRAKTRLAILTDDDASMAFFSQMPPV